MTNCTLPNTKQKQKRKNESKYPTYNESLMPTIYKAATRNKCVEII